MPELSICIPTYNKSGYLYFTLKSIVEQDIFKNTNDVEIVISDNCSSDFTQKISMLFADKFPGKIIYHRNEENIAEKNIEKALSLGTGAVLKLHNDNFVFLENSLERIVKQIQQQKAERFLIFFANGHSLLQRKSICNDLTDLVKAASYLTTNISSFSIWKEDFDTFKEQSGDIYPPLIQTNILFNFASQERNILIFNEPVFEIRENLEESKFNLTYIFGEKYLSLLKSYWKNKKLEWKTYEKEKEGFLLNYVIPKQFSNYSSYDDNDYWKTLIKYYWYNPYFYISIFKILKLKFKAKFKSLLKRFNKNAYQLEWRQKNTHNESTITKNVNMEKVFVGKNSKGLIDVKFSANPYNLLIIEDNVTIQEDVKFVFGIKELIIIKDCTIIKKGSVITR